MIAVVPGPELLARARLLVAPELNASLVRELERIAGRGAEPLADEVPGGGPLLCVGAALPGSVRATAADRLVWFHSVNAGTDPLLAAGPWPAGALLTRTVGRMGERIAQYVVGWVLAECQAVPEYVGQHARAEWRRLPTELVAGQTALVYGTGRIGGAVAGLLRRCGVRRSSMWGGARRWIWRRWRVRCGTVECGARCWTCWRRSRPRPTTRSGGCPVR